MKFSTLLNRYTLYGACCTIAGFRFFSNSYVSEDAVGARHGVLLDAGFHPRMPFSDTNYVLPRKFTSADGVDVMIMWPGNGTGRLRVKMESVPLRIGKTSDEQLRALNNVAYTNNWVATSNAMFDPATIESRQHASVPNNTRYFGLSLLTRDYHVAHWTHLCELAADATSKHLTEHKFAPHVDVAVDVLIEKLGEVLNAQCGLTIDGHVSNVQWKDIAPQ